jgi:hypothetical protein
MRGLVSWAERAPRGIDVLLRRGPATVNIDNDPLPTVARGSGQALEELDSLRRARDRRRRRHSNLGD